MSTKATATASPRSGGGTTYVPPMRLAVLVRHEEVARSEAATVRAGGASARAACARRAWQPRSRGEQFTRTRAAAPPHAAAAARTAAAAAAAGAAGAAAGAAHLSLVDRMGRVIGAELHRGVLAVPRAKPRRHEGACRGAQRARRPHGGAARLLQP